MNNDVISLAINLKLILGPVRSNFRGRIDHEVIIGKLPFALVIPVRTAVDDAPARRRINEKLHRIGLVIHDVHEDGAAIVVGVARIKLRESAGKIVAENFIANRQIVCVLCLNTPGLIVYVAYRKIWQPTFEPHLQADATQSFKLLHVLGEVENGITTGRPLGHLEVEVLLACVSCYWQLNFNGYFKQM